MRRPLLILVGAAVSGIFFQNAHAMDFRYVATDGAAGVIVAAGQINLGDDERLHDYVARLHPGTTVVGMVLESPGGNLREGVYLATTIRNSRIATGVFDRAECASACFLMFAAGSHRTVGPHARIGVHSASHSGEDDPVAQAVTTLMARKAADLGVPSDIIGRMVTTPPSQIAWLTPDELAEMHVEVLTADSDSYRPGSALSPGSVASTNAPTPAPAPAPAPTTAPVTAFVPIGPPNDSFQQGRRDRVTYESWFDRQPEGEVKSGALWWAANRTQALRQHLFCGMAGVSATFAQGCTRAQELLATPDARRRSDVDYRAGWNSL